MLPRSAMLRLSGRGHSWNTFIHQTSRFHFTPLRSLAAASPSLDPRELPINRESSCALQRAIHVATLGLPQLLSVCNEQHASYASTLSLNDLFKRMTTETRRCYPEAARLFAYNSPFSIAELASILLCTHARYPVDDMLGTLPGTTDLSWEQLVDTGIVFGTRDMCYALPPMLWWPGCAAAVADSSKLSDVVAYIRAECVPGFALQNIVVDPSMGDGPSLPVTPFHYTRMFATALATRHWFLRQATAADKLDEEELLPLSEVYSCSSGSWTERFLADKHVDLSGGVVSAECEVMYTDVLRDVASTDYADVLSSSGGSTGSMFVTPHRAIHVNPYRVDSETKSSMAHGRHHLIRPHHDAILPFVSPTSDAATPPTNLAIVAQPPVAGKPSGTHHIRPKLFAEGDPEAPCDLLWLWPEWDDARVDSPRFKDVEVRRALDAHQARLCFVSGEGCMSPAVLDTIRWMGGLTEEEVQDDSEL